MTGILNARYDPQTRQYEANKLPVDFLESDVQTVHTAEKVNPRISPLASSATSSEVGTTVGQIWSHLW